MDRIRRLAELGQSVWLDLDLGIGAEDMDQAKEAGVAGVALDASAVGAVASLDAAARAPTAGSGPPSEPDARVLERVVVRAATLACDRLRPLYDASSGADGFASIPVAAPVAGDCAACVEQACRLWSLVGRPNLVVRIPGTRAALPAIESCLSHGLNVEAALVFSAARAREVADAWRRALAARASRGDAVDRVTALIGVAGGGFDAAAANAALVHEEHERFCALSPVEALRARGARPPRLRWIATSGGGLSDPSAIDVLVAPATIVTMTREGLRAYGERGEPAARLPRSRSRAHEEADRLAKHGVDFACVAEALEREALAARVEAYDRAVALVATRRRRPGAQARA